ncbi:MAG: tetratricopeptide (TPR) repeat protein [Kiritimatiellia bacterium]|jgi:tetratricopeptide (TPR) repeat protein
MLSGLWWIVAQVALAGVTVSLPTSDSEIVFDDSGAAAVESGLSALASGKFTDAARSFRALAEAGGGERARYLEALAWYESGDLRRARRVCDAAVTEATTFGPLLALQGLVLTDLGDRTAAEAALDRAVKVSPKDAALQGRVALSRALLQLDGGGPKQALALIDRATELAEQSGDEELAVKAAQLRALASGTPSQGSQTGLLDEVVAHLRAGDVQVARSAVGEPREGDRRDGVVHLLAAARVDRAVGDYDACSYKLRVALQLGREGGLVRETSAVLSALGTLYSLAGRFELAVAHQQEAVGLVVGTNHRLAELSYRIEAGRAAVYQGDLRQAHDQLDVAARLVARVHDPLVSARLAELRGLVASRGDQQGGGASDLLAALDIYEDHRHWLDAARVATDLSGVYAGVDERRSTRWGERAVTHFKRVENEAGQAHVLVAQGLGLVRRKSYEPALTLFVRAAHVADSLDTDRGRQVASHARENAARALKALGHTAHAQIGELEGKELDQLLAQQRVFGAAELDYDTGKAQFDRGEYTDALAAFDRAVKAFELIHEEGYASTARRARGWAARNMALRKTPGAAAPLFLRAQRDAEAVGDAELRARSMAGRALAKAKLSHDDAIEALFSAADATESVGLMAESAGCLAEIVERAGDLGVRVSAARRAYNLAGPDDPAAVYAMYSVAVDAYNQDDLITAVELSDEILPHAGDLQEAVRSVRQAAVEASSTAP